MVTADQPSTRAGNRRLASELTSAADSGAIETFLSPLVLEILARNRAHLDAPFGEERQAAMLYIDAAGFSRLCARLVSQDNRGAEEVGRIVNGHFRWLIETVEGHGGIVSTLAGDALVALWPLDDGDIGAAVQRAMRCGLEVTANGDTTQNRLAVRSIVDVGPLRLAHVGGHNGNWSVITCGRLLEMLPRIAGNGSDGMLWGSGPAYDRVPLGCKADPASGGGYMIREVGPPPALTQAATLASAGLPLKAYVPRSIRFLLSDSQVEWLSEFRRTTVLFCRFDGFDSSLPAALDRLHGLVRDLQSAVDEFDGDTLQVMVDDKGLILLAVWGLAVNTSEHDAERAVRAGERIQVAARAADCSPAIGICTGKVFAGVVGSAQFRQYSVFGDSVNGAAWLMQQSHDGPLCDDATRIAADGYRFVQTGELVPKGRSEPEPVYTPAGPHRRAVVVQASRTFGRDAELGHMCAAVDDAEGALVWVHGEPGIGKSHLARAMMDHLVEHGRQYVHLQSENIGRVQPYGPWRGVFGELLALPEDAMDETALITHLLAVLGDIEKLEARLPLVNAALGLSLPETAHTSGLSGAQRADQTRMLLTDMLVRLLRDSPRALVVEDTQWMDTASWLLLVDIHARRSETDILTFSRPLDFDTLPPEAGQLLRSAGLTEIALGPLDAAGTADLIADVLGADGVPRDLARRIYERAEGHAYYTKELAAALAQRGIVHVENGYCHIGLGLADLSEVSFPENIEDAIATRFSMLSSGAQLTLKVASVESRKFELAHVRAIHPDDPAMKAVQEHMQSARGAGLVESDDDSGMRFSFHHALARETIYNLLIRDQRRRLHAVSAHEHERNGAGDDPEMSALLARHWLNAGEEEKAIAYLLRAAQHAESGQNHIEAANFLTRAIAVNEACDEPGGSDVTGVWHADLGRNLLEIGAVHRSIEHMARAVSDLTGRSVPSRASLISRLLWEFILLKTRPMRAEQPDTVRKPLLLAGETCFRLAFQHYEVQEVICGIFYAVHMVNLGKRAGGDNAPLAIGNASLAIASLSLPFLLDGSRHRRYALEMSERLGDHACRFWVRFNLGTYESGAAEFANARENLEAALAIAARQMKPRDWQTAAAGLANLYRTMGLYRQSAEMDGQVLVAARDRGINLQQMWALTGLIRSLFWFGDLDGCRSAAARLRAMLSDPENDVNSSGQNIVALSTAEANLHLLDGELDAAVDKLSQAVSVFAGIAEPQIYMEDAPGYIGDGLMRAWQLGGSGWIVRLARRNAKLARRLARLYPVARPKTPLVAGDLALYRGRLSRAASLWRKSATMAEALQMPAQAAHARSRLALSTMDGHGDREEERARVAAIFADDLGVRTPFHWDQLMAHDA